MIEVGDVRAQNSEPPKIRFTRRWPRDPTHQEKPGNFRWRSPGADTAFSFIVEQPFAMNGRTAILLERGGEFATAGMIASGPRSPTPGAPYTYVTTQEFLVAFGLDTLRDLPDFAVLEDAGLLSKERLLAGDIPSGLVREAEDEPDGYVVQDEAL